MVSEFPQYDLDARQGEEALVGFEQPVMSDLDAALKPKPRVRPLNDVAQSIAMRPGVLPELRPAATWSFIDPFRDDRRDPTPPQCDTKRSAVVGPVGQQPARPSSASPLTPSSDRDLLENAVRELQFMDVGSVKNERERSSASVDEDRPLGSLSDLGDADTAAPFFAAAKLASRIPCDSLSRPRFPSCPSRTRRTRVHTPSRCQRTSLSQQVDGAPYSRGMSFQRQPVLRTNRIPLMVRWSSTRARPRRFLRGSNGWMSFQSLADRSVSRMRGSFSAKERSLRYFNEHRRAKLNQL